MHICVIYYSHTGHTKQVVDKVIDELRQHNHQVKGISLEPVEPFRPSAESAELKIIPDISPYECIIISTPVHGGRMSAPMRWFLNEVPSLSGTLAAGVVTHFFREGWGAVQTLQEIETALKGKSTAYLGGVNVRWFSLSRQKQIRTAAVSLASWIEKPSR